MHIIKDSLSGSQVANNKSKFFNKAVSFLYISGQRNDLGCELCGLHGCDMANQHNPSALIQKFLAEIGYSFVDVIDYQILESFNIIMEAQSEEYRREQVTSFAITTEVKSVTFPRMIQLQL